MIARGKREQREARRPWLPDINEERTLKVRNIIGSYSALSELHAHFVLPRGDAPRFARRLPLAVIFRAFGAVFRV
jgi:hypothetical protein